MNTSQPTVQSVHQTSGFTLLELLTATAIGSLLVVMLLSAFNQASKAWIAGEGQVDIYQNGRAVLDLLARDLSQVRVGYNCGFTAQVVGASKKMIFPAAVGDASDPSDINVVSYSYDASICSLSRSNFVGTTREGDVLLSSNLMYCNFQYYTNRNHRLYPSPFGMTSYASTGAAPVAVLVTLRILDARHTREYWSSPTSRLYMTNSFLREFTQMIYLPCSQP